MGSNPTWDTKWRVRIMVVQRSLTPLALDRNQHSLPTTKKQCCRCEYRRGAKVQNPREDRDAEAASMAVGLLQHLHRVKRRQLLASGEMIYLLAVLIPIRHTV